MSPDQTPDPERDEPDDGIERFDIEEWHRRFGRPAPTLLHYDALAE